MIMRPRRFGKDNTGIIIYYPSPPAPPMNPKEVKQVKTPDGNWNQCYLEVKQVNEPIALYEKLNQAQSVCEMNQILLKATSVGKRDFLTPGGAQWQINVKYVQTKEPTAAPPPPPDCV